jgi:hypothetical protein
MSDEKIGRFKKSLGEKCPFCKSPLQERTREIPQLVRGEMHIIEEDYIRCSNPNCLYEEEIEQKKRKEKIDKATFYQEPLPEKKAYNKGRNDNGYNKRRGTSSPTPVVSPSGYRRNNNGSPKTFKRPNPR